MYIFCLFISIIKIFIELWIYLINNTFINISTISRWPVLNLLIYLLINTLICIQWLVVFYSNINNISSINLISPLYIYMQNIILQLHIPSVLCMSKILYVDFVWSTLDFRSYDVIDWLDCLICHDHISRGVDHTKSTYKNIASSDHRKSTYKTRSQKSTYKKKGPKKRS